MISGAMYCRVPADRGTDAQNIKIKDNERQSRFFEKLVFTGGERTNLCKLILINIHFY